MNKSPLGGEKTGKNPTDRGKIGVKRSVLIDGHGVPLGVAVDGANVHDQRLVKATLDNIPVRRPPPTARQQIGAHAAAPLSVASKSILPALMSLSTSIKPDAFRLDRSATGLPNIRSASVSIRRTPRPRIWLASCLA